MISHIIFDLCIKKLYKKIFYYYHFLVVRDVIIIMRRKKPQTRKEDMRISNRVIYRLFRNIERNRKRKDRGIPVSAVLFYKRGEIKFSANNKRTENKMPNSNTHAELLCLNNFKGRGKHEDNKYRLIVLLEPCEDCIEVINTDGRISEVIYLTNEKYGKSKLGLLNVPHTLYEPNKETKPIVDKLLANFKKFQKTKFYTRKEGE